MHGTTRERPIERFAQEQNVLTPLPSRSFVGTYQAIRTVSWDCLISYGGTRYSVPWQYAGSQVWVRSSQGARIVITSQAGEELAAHAVPERKGVTVIDQRHYAGLRAGLPTTKRRVIELFLQRFPDHGWFVEGLYDQFPAAGAAPLRSILGLSELYPREALLEAFAAARRYNTFTQAFLRGVLEAQGSSVAGSPPEHANVPLSLRGDLQVYQRILEAAG